MHPGVEQHVGAFEPHLRRVARRKVLHVHRCRDDGARHAHPLGDVTLHLRAEHQFGLQLGDARLDLEVVVADQRLDAVQLGGLAHFAREFAAVGADADDGEAHFLRGHARRSHGVRGIAEHEHALARQVGGIDRARVPRRPRALAVQHGLRIDTRQLRHLGDEIARGAVADRHGFGGRLSEIFGQPCRGERGDLGVQHDVEVGVTQAREVGRRGAERRHHVDVDAQLPEQAANLAQVVAVAKSQRGRAEDVAARTPGRVAHAPRAAGHYRRAGQRSHHLVEGFGRAPVFLALVRRQFERDHRDRQVERLGEATRVVLNQLGGARGANQHRLRLEALERIARRVLEQLGRVAAQIARLERGVSDRRPFRQPLDHREQQIGVGVALRCVQHVMHAFHGGGDAHRADVRRAFVGPQGQLHRMT